MSLNISYQQIYLDYLKKVFEKAQSDVPPSEENYIVDRVKEKFPEFNPSDNAIGAFIGSIGVEEFNRSRSDGTYKEKYKQFVINSANKINGFASQFCFELFSKYSVGFPLSIDQIRIVIDEETKDILDFESEHKTEDEIFDEIFSNIDVSDYH